MTSELREERPILFSGPMVRAILDGRKTQTRRVLTRQNSTASGYKGKALWESLDFASPKIHKDGNPLGEGGLGCGQYLHVPDNLDDAVHRVRFDTEPGDRLWVRESIKRESLFGERVEYCADHSIHPDANWAWPHRETLPSIFMPRGLSRIALEVTEVRVQRLQELTDGDAEAEGCAPFRGLGDGSPLWNYLNLWNSLNAKRGFGWESNPWVWAITFRAARGGV